MVIYLILPLLSFIYYLCISDYAMNIGGNQNASLFGQLEIPMFILVGLSLSFLFASQMKKIIKGRKNYFPISSIILLIILSSHTLVSLKTGGLLIALLVSAGCGYFMGKEIKQYIPHH